MITNTETAKSPTEPELEKLSPAVASVMLYHDLSTNRMWVLLAGLLEEDIGKREKPSGSENGDDVVDNSSRPVYMADGEVGFNWGGISGGVGVGETAAQALAREIKEETRLSPSVRSYLADPARQMRLKTYQVDQLRPTNGDGDTKAVTYEVNPRVIIIDEMIFEELLKHGFEAYCLDLINDETLSSIRPAIRPIVEQLKQFFTSASTTFQT
ncbi:MAG: hypothetical protein XD95_0239 [Microgenomates bacterium 39_7]|nr:MAG: hypothetical protein XD95_0239 [Microgenomates bacterium 39_7]